MRQLKILFGFLLVTALVAFLYVMNAEYFYGQDEKAVVFNSYLQRASDPHEKSLRLVNSSHTPAERSYKMGRARVDEATLEFAEEKYILNFFKKIYKLNLKRKQYPGKSELDQIEASLLLTIDYRAQKDFTTIFGEKKVLRDEKNWEAMNSLFDNPANKVKKKIK
jgi:hypothetical protein